jgi:hypothetical protein
MESLNGTASHTLTVEVVSGWGGVYVQSCAVNGAALPAAIVPHDVLQVTLLFLHYVAAYAFDSTCCSLPPPGPFPMRPPRILALTPTILPTVRSV